MSDTETNKSEEKSFCVDRAKQGRAACKKCKDKCATGELRIAKVGPSPFGDGKMKNWHHLHCLFEQFLKQRVTTKRIESPDDLDGWDSLTNEDKQEIEKRIEECEKAIIEKYGDKAVVKKPKPVTPTKNKNSLTTSTSTSDSEHSQKEFSPPKDLLFREFRQLVANISNVPSYTDKTNLVNAKFTKGNDGKGFKGNVTQWCRLLLPGVIKRTYNLQSKQLIKILSRIFNTDQESMLDYLKQGDIGETIQYFFEQSKDCKPRKKSLLAIQEVDDFLETLSKLTKEEEQEEHFSKMMSKCTSNDLKIIIRLIKHDLRMNAGAKHILDAIHPDAYQAYQASRDLDMVISRCIGGTSKSDDNLARVKAAVNVMTPVQPMLAEACKSIEQAMRKCPNGMFAEIKYDGERVQLHKHGDDFKYFSRSLKPVLRHKVSHFQDYIPKAFPHAKDLILDCEILMIDMVTGKPLPFGTLGVHKKSEFKDACVCLFVFDCIYFNGVSLLNKPLDYRKDILKDNMSEIPNRIMFSEMEVIDNPRQLTKMITKVLEMGLEGLVLKDVKSVYKPGKRHWLKVKKDYLHDGAMADTADLIVLGAWYGTGKKAGMMSVFLMGCYDPNRQKFCTVTKVHTGHDDKTLEQLQKELQMIEIGSDPLKVPNWLKCTKSMIPDFVAADPQKQPVWEITGAEFTQHDVHTADGISIRFPRVTKIRHDKNWNTATTLEELKVLFKKSKENTDIKLLMDLNESESSKQSALNNNKRKRDHSTSPSSKILAADTKNNLIHKIKNPLPDVFVDVKLFVEKKSQIQLKELLRYFIAYGGALLKPEEYEEATHVVHLEDSVLQPTKIFSKETRHIIPEWVRDSVCNGRLLDFRPYTVELQPFS